MPIVMAVSWPVETVKPFWASASAELKASPASNQPVKRRLDFGVKVALLALACEPGIARESNITPVPRIVLPVARANPLEDGVVDTIVDPRVALYSRTFSSDNTS